MRHSERESGSEETAAPGGQALRTAGPPEVALDMKSEFKRFLFVGMSLALVALTARRSRQESEIEADIVPGAEPRIEPLLDTPPSSRLHSHALQHSPNGFSLNAHSATHTGVLAETIASLETRRTAIPMVAPTVTFSGTVVRSGPCFALRETAGVLYPLDSAGRAWPFEGEDVRVTGKLDLDTRLLYVDAIEPVPF